MDKLEIKAIPGPIQLKEGGEPGAVSAVFSTFNVVDGDGDVVLSTAFTHGQKVPMTWAHDWSKPVGKGQILIEQERAVFDGGFFLETDMGLEAYKTVKAMSAANLQDWSWGFRVLDASFEERDAKPVRVIKRAQVFEVSPVLVGAGVDTYTLGIKSGLPYADEAEQVLATCKAFTERSTSLADVRRKDGRVLSEANRKRLGGLLDALKAVQADIEDLLQSTEPPAKGASLLTEFVRYQKITAQIRAIGV
jgi:HK97 family phage prohead protease